MTDTSPSKLREEFAVLVARLDATTLQREILQHSLEHELDEVRDRHRPTAEQFDDAVELATKAVVDFHRKHRAALEDDTKTIEVPTGVVKAKWSDWSLVVHDDERVRKIVRGLRMFNRYFRKPKPRELDKVTLKRDLLKPGKLRDKFGDAIGLTRKEVLTVTFESDMLTVDHDGKRDPVKVDINSETS